MSKAPESLIWIFVGSILANGILERLYSTTRQPPVRTPANVHCTITPTSIVNCDLSKCAGRRWGSNDPPVTTDISKCARDLSPDEKEPPK